MISLNPPITTPADDVDHPQHDVILSQVEQIARRLAEARQRCAEYHAALDTLFDRFYADPMIQALATQLHDAQVAQNHADEELRSAMVTAYQLLGTNRFSVAGEVRLMHEVVYHCSDQELLTTLRTWMPDVVITIEQVDRRKLEKRLRTEPDTYLPGVQVQRIPKAFINTDLRPALSPAGSAGTEPPDDHCSGHYPHSSTQ